MRFLFREGAISIGLKGGIFFEIIEKRFTTNTTISGCRLGATRLVYAVYRASHIMFLVVDTLTVLCVLKNWVTEYPTLRVSVSC
jgi:hypothetical protein